MVQVPGALGVAGPVKRLALIALAASALLAATAPTAGAQSTPPCQNIAVPLPDGVKLDGWFRPAAGGGRAPVLWTMTPYDNDACPGGASGIDGALGAKFNLIRLSYRGTGASEGTS